MRVASRFGIKFPNFFESIFQALRRFCSVLNGLRPGKVARLNRFFQDDLHGLREFVIPGIQLAFVIVKFHTDLKMNNARCRRAGSEVTAVPAARAYPGPPFWTGSKLNQYRDWTAPHPWTRLLGFFQRRVAAFVALKYPLPGLRICICCLIVYLKPDPSGA